MRPLTAEDICPYVSVFCATVVEGLGAPERLVDMLHQLAELLELDPADYVAEPRILESSEAGLHAFCIYRKRTSPSWLRAVDLEVENVETHLVLLSEVSGCQFAYMSDVSARRKYLSLLAEEPGLNPIPRGQLEGALTGPLRTLWLTGTHRSVDVKADGKVLVGRNLGSALSPLQDQTFYYNAARATTAQGTAIGISPKESRLWAGPSGGWASYKKTLWELTESLAKEAAGPRIPVLAVPADGSVDIGEAYDIMIQPPELLGFNSTSDGLGAERWAYESRFEVSPGDGASFTAKVHLGDKYVGEVEVEVDFETPGLPRFAVTHALKEDHLEAEWEELIGLLRPSTTKIYYSSGVTMSGGELYRVQHRNLPFGGIHWEDFTGFDVSKEKPLAKDSTTTADLSLIEGGDSLFSWVFGRWYRADRERRRGWLICDDGAGEIADFIHLGVDDRLSLIHVKASSDKKSRRVAIVPYEQVAAQALKNLRFLDLQVTRDRLAAALTSSRANRVWKGGRPTVMKDLLVALDQVGSSHEREVVILQPHLRKVRAQAARKRSRHRSWAAIHSLDTLLNATEASCHELGASLKVIASV